MNQGEKQYMVLTAVGPDRSGLVKEVAAVIHQAGCNLEDSRMAVLAGEFALIVLFSGTAEAIARVQHDRPKLEQELGFSLTFKSTQARLSEPAQGLFRLEVSGVDQPGIVRHVSEVLASEQINVRSLESRLRHAAFSGTALFFLHAELELPAQGQIEELRAKLERVCEVQHLGYTLEPLKEND
jgi:glycine cleavage system transcriptional repressor